uniref:Uncharacterized protein n=2 Tax=Rhodnius prolixus TaxID=13249 RepID=T1HUV8_RHOPR
MFILQIAFLLLFNNFQTKGLQLDIFRKQCWNITEDNLIKNCTKKIQECICCSFIKNKDIKENCTKNCCDYKKEKFLNNNPLNVSLNKTKDNILNKFINKIPLIYRTSINKIKKKYPTVKKKILTNEMLKALHKLVHKEKMLVFNKKKQSKMPNINNNQTENIDKNNFSIASSLQKMHDENLSENYIERKFPKRVRFGSNFTSYSKPKSEQEELTMKERKMRPNLILTTSSESIKKKEPISIGSNFSFSENNLSNYSMLHIGSKKDDDYHQNPIIAENGLKKSFSKNGMDFYRTTIFDRNHNIVEMNLDNEKIDNFLLYKIDNKDKNNNMDKNK